MAAFSTKRPRKTGSKSVYLRGAVTCRRCEAPLYVYKLDSLPEEFSVRCGKCGDRGFYAKRALSVQEMPERRRKPRK